MRHRNLNYLLRYYWGSFFRPYTMMLTLAIWHTKTVCFFFTKSETIIFIHSIWVGIIVTIGSNFVWISHKCWCKGRQIELLKDRRRNVGSMMPIHARVNWVFVHYYVIWAYSPYILHAWRNQSVAALAATNLFPLTATQDLPRVTYILPSPVCALVRCKKLKKNNDDGRFSPTPDRNQ
jgi:hypothetical protein